MRHALRARPQTANADFRKCKICFLIKTMSSLSTMFLALSLESFLRGHLRNMASLSLPALLATFLPISKVLCLCHASIGHSSTGSLMFPLLVSRGLVSSSREQNLCEYLKFPEKCQIVVYILMSFSSSPPFMCVLLMYACVGPCPPL